MNYCKTSLTLDSRLVDECKKIAFKNDVSFSRFVRDLMRGAVKTQQRAAQRARSIEPKATTLKRSRPGAVRSSHSK